MAAGAVVRALIEQEARALLTRLDHLQPFALSETMVPAATLPPEAQWGIERFMLIGRGALRRRAAEYLRWLTGRGKDAAPDEQQRRFVVIRMQFNDVLSQLDLFSEVITQRSEHSTGVWLSGLDVLAADALAVRGYDLAPPPVVCYLARGPGAAIRRARTRLPGGASNPVSIIRVPRERMIGHGIASSLIHEVGHQAAALLDLVPSVQSAVRRRGGEPSPATATADGTVSGSPWQFMGQWASEILADLWSVGKLGIGSTLGLMGVVSLPRTFVFRPSGTDPHPIPAIRVLLSCAMGDALYPHPQWRQLADIWQQMYPQEGLPKARRRHLEELESVIPEFVAITVGHRPPALGGRSLGEVLADPERRPERLLATFDGWHGNVRRAVNTAPSMAFAAVGQARSMRRITAGAENRLLSDLLTAWALRSSLEVTSARTTPRLSSPRSRPIPAATVA